MWSSFWFRKWDCITEHAHACVLYMCTLFLHACGLCTATEIPTYMRAAAIGMPMWVHGGPPLKQNTWTFFFLPSPFAWSTPTRRASQYMLNPQCFIFVAQLRSGSLTAPNIFLAKKVNDGSPWFSSKVAWAHAIWVVVGGAGVLGFVSFQVAGILWFTCILLRRLIHWKTLVSSSLFLVRFGLLWSLLWSLSPLGFLLSHRWGGHRRLSRRSHGTTLRPLCRSNFVIPWFRKQLSTLRCAHVRPFGWLHAHIHVIPRFLRNIFRGLGWLFCPTPAFPSTLSTSPAPPTAILAIFLVLFRFGCHCKLLSTGKNLRPEIWIKPRPMVSINLYYILYIHACFVKTNM